MTAEQPLGIRLVKQEKELPSELHGKLEWSIPAIAYLLYLGEQLIGWGQLISHNPQEQELAYVEIKPEYQHKGFGKILVQFIVYNSPAHQIVALSITPDFFTKIGFAKKATYPSFVNHHDPECQQCTPAKCTSLIFTKPAELTKFETDEARRNQYFAFLKAGRFMGSEFSYANELTWSYAENIYFIEIDSYLFFCAYPFNETPFGVIFPYCDLPEATIEKFLDQLIKLNIKDIFYVSPGATKILQRHTHTKYSISLAEDSDNNDYIYRVKDFAKFAGKKYEKKRNRLNKFLRNNPNFVINPYAPEHQTEIMNFAKETFHKMGLSVNSLQVMELGFKYNLYQGFFVTINTQIIGLLLYSELNVKTAIVHFELTNELYDGVAPFMNQELGKQLLKRGYKFINREQDLGIEGLRKSKKSYHPFLMIRKYAAEAQNFAPLPE